MTHDITEIRRRRLKALIDQYGSGAALARALGHTYHSYISQLLTGTRGIGERAARAIEIKLLLPRGWMDRETHDTQPATVSVDAKLFASAVEAAGAALTASGNTLSAAKFGEVVLMVYDDARAKGRVDPEMAARAISLTS